MTLDVQSAAAATALAKFLDEQVSSLIQLEPSLRNSRLERVSRIHPLFAAVIEDAISIRLLGDASRLNQAYILSRALLERVTNYCFLQLCPDNEFSDYIEYSLNKIGRRTDRFLEAEGKVQARIALKEGTFELPSEIVAAVAKFTSERGGEKTRWTNTSLPERAAVIEAKIGSTGLFISLLAIYGDASEALHGTLYGALFHLGTYDFGSIPHDQQSLERHRCSTLSCLYLMSGGAIDTLLSLLSSVGEKQSHAFAKSSTERFKRVSVECGLLANRVQPEPSTEG
jgi:hypothetical protein